jgi:hypothetical protein
MILYNIILYYIIYCMNIVQTLGDPDIYRYTTHTVVEDHVNFRETVVNENGLLKKYDCFHYNDNDFPWYHINASGGRDYPQEFSLDNQEILKKYLDLYKTQRDQFVIVEIGVNRNEYNKTSTSIFLDNKRDTDIYIGIDIVDKSELNDNEKNIFTIQDYSQNINSIFAKFKELNVTKIDILMIDGHHSINQVYFEWENYTKLLANNGIVICHDTNAHPGPYFLIKSIDTNQYDVYKYLSDVVDWGISVAIKK